MKTALLIFIVFNFMVISIQAQQDKTVIVTVVGYGPSKEKAVQNALRSAIEMAFGAFISAKTEIINDELMADEITSVASGNIQSYSVLNESVSNDNLWAVNAKVEVSIGKLTEFVQAKGISVEVKGELFAMNIKQKMLNEEGEIKSLTNMFEILHNEMQRAFDYEIEIGEFKSLGQDWEVSITVNAIANKNMIFCEEFLYNTLSSISLTEQEVAEYLAMNKPIFFTGIISSKLPQYYIAPLPEYQAKGYKYTSSQLTRMQKEVDKLNAGESADMGVWLKKNSPHRLSTPRYVSKKTLHTDCRLPDMFFLRAPWSGKIIRGLLKNSIVYGLGFKVSSNIHEFILIDSEDHLYENRQTIDFDQGSKDATIRSINALGMEKEEKLGSLYFCFLYHPYTYEYFNELRYARESAEALSSKAGLEARIKKAVRKANGGFLGFSRDSSDLINLEQALKKKKSFPVAEDLGVFLFPSPGELVKTVEFSDILTLEQMEILKSYIVEPRAEVIQFDHGGYVFNANDGRVKLVKMKIK